MELPTDIEGLVQAVTVMDRRALVSVLRDVPCPFPVDFTEAYLEGLELERLRHLTLAVCLQARKSRRRGTTSAA